MKRSILLMIITIIAFTVSTGLADERERAESVEKAASEQVRHEEDHREVHESAEAAARREREIHEEELRNLERRDRRDAERREAAEREMAERQEHRKRELEKQEREISGTRRAKSLIKVTCDYNMLPADGIIIENIVSGSSVAIRAIREMGLNPADNEEKIVIEALYLRGDDNCMIFNIIVELEDTEPIAEELMHAVINHLREALEITFHQHMEEKERSMQRAIEKCINAENQLKEIQHQTREIASNSPVNREELQAMIQDFTNELSNMDMDMAFSEHRIKELSEQMAKARGQAEERLQADPVLHDLREIIASSEKNLRLTEEQVKSGRHPAEMLEQAKEKLIKARIELARRREELIHLHGGNKAEQLAEKTTDLAMQMSQFRVKRESVMRRLEETRQKLTHADEYEILSIKIEMAKEKLARALEIKNELELMDIQPPHVYVIGGD